MWNSGASSLLGTGRRGKIFLVSAPAGTGKTTLVHMLLDEFSTLRESVSYTTRIAREGEVEGQHYHFVTQEAFDAMVEKEEFLEYVNLYSHSYGTPRRWVEEQLVQGVDVVLVIDTQGALLLKGKVDATLIFISPPTLEDLRVRLNKRKTESPEAIEKRLAIAEDEISQVKQYDYHIINDDLQTAYQVLRSILIAEGHRT